MINTKELRKGNLVHYTPIHGDKPGIVIIEEILHTKVSFSNERGNTEGSCPYGHLSGILLTTEYLERCGFVNIGTDELGGWHNYRKKMPYLHSVSIWKGQGGFQFTYDGSVKFIHHVHQLQNLFLALTGEELTIKEPA